jgi:potassium-transporting ATPase KdpC subunit
MQEQKTSKTPLAHVRANLWLLVLTLTICCVLYPGAVWVVGQLLFHNQAQGSLIDAKGEPTSDPAKAVGSRLIAQQFNSSVFFQPRPSSVSYNAAASGGSNFAASNPKLRGRVAQMLGLIVLYSKTKASDHKGAPIGPDVEEWFKGKTKDKPDFVNDWVAANPTLAQVWATSSDPIKNYINDWAKAHPDVMDAWKKANPDLQKNPGPDDLVVFFFQSYLKEHPGTWPVQTQETDKDGKQQTVIKPDTAGSDIQSMFFDMWLTEQVKNKKLDPVTDLEQVPADMVTTSGSGLDPDISLRNAKYQSDGVVAANVKNIVAAYESEPANKKATPEQIKAVADELRKEIDELLSQEASRPMFGLSGDEPLINVLQVNLAVKAKVDALRIK